MTLLPFASLPKHCIRCGEVKQDHEFYAAQNRCMDCHKAYSAEWDRAHPFARSIRNAKHRAKCAEVPFDLTEEYLEDIWTGTCPVFYLRLAHPVIGEADEETVFRPSLDRMQPAAGYVRGNVIWLSDRANRIKNDASSQDLLTIGTWLEGVEHEIRRHRSH